MSESHHRQMRLFRENSGKYMSYYSDMFKKGFIEVLRRRARNRVKANTVYQEYIKDRHHVHMNSTCWETLSSFVIFLGSKGIADIDQTEKGWYVKYKDMDPERMAKRQAAERLDKMKMTADAVSEKQIMDQVKRAHDMKSGQKQEEKKELNRDEMKDLKIALKAKKKEAPAINIGKQAVFENATSGLKNKKKRKKEYKKSNLQQIMEQEKAKRRKKETSSKPYPKNVRKENWIFKDLVVKVLHKLNDKKYYKKKGVVKKVHNKFEAEVKMKDSGDIIRLDQEYLETVIPGVGKPVLVVNGSFRGYEGEVLSLDDDPKADQPTVTVKIVVGEWKGEKVSGIELEDVCKLA
eukprot:CAMPEP_0167760300 /NCGR_PEP_ID=MMETSP0110_2-20121227/11510_1 /TAXON_ID=629695 /ORGANISM="Gymnochlora sp., Strain CCMP2014" /LENGTH=348 /DNA_ID=CAMNT_0007646797 /DNA_START=177 /DNA_END=1223 /DNA_ORIENTATION=+